MASPNSSASVGLQNLSSNQAIRLLCYARGVDCNVVGDTVMPIINSTKYSVLNCILTNASVSLSTAHGAIFPSPAGAGTAIVSDAALSGASASTVVVAFTTNSTAAQTGQNLYFRVGTAQGAAATADVYVYGYDLDIV